MSLLSEENRGAIYTLLMADGSFMELSPGGVHFLVAPLDTPGAYTILTRIPISANYALADNLVYENDLWLVKVYVPDGFEADEMQGAILAEAILQRAETVLKTPFTLTAGRSLFFRRESEIPSFFEADTEKFSVGANFRAITNV